MIFPGFSPTQVGDPNVHQLDQMTSWLMTAAGLRRIA